MGNSCHTSHLSCPQTCCTVTTAFKNCSCEDIEVFRQFWELLSSFVSQAPHITANIQSPSLIQNHSLGTAVFMVLQCCCGAELIKAARVGYWWVLHTAKSTILNLNSPQVAVQCVFHRAHVLVYAGELPVSYLSWIMWLLPTAAIW